MTKVALTLLGYVLANLVERRKVGPSQKIIFGYEMFLYSNLCCVLVPKLSLCLYVFFYFVLLTHYFLYFL